MLSVSNLSVEVLWKKPELNLVYKMNWDAVLDIHNVKIGAGIVIRNWEGDLLASTVLPRTFVFFFFLENQNNFIP